MNTAKTDPVWTFFLSALSVQSDSISQTHAHFNHNLVKPKFASREAISMMAD